MIRAVIFDMFETLVSLFQGRTYFGEHIAADAGLDPEDFRREWHGTEHQRTIGELTIEEALRICFERLGKYGEDAVERASAGRRKGLDDSFDPVPEESVKLLRELRRRGIMTGLITNAFSDEREYIRKSGLLTYFDVALISYEQGMSKPDLAIYRKMIKELGVEPGECLYVGDGGSRELFAASEAGMRAVQAVWFRSMAYEPHIPSPVLTGYEQVKRQKDILKYLTPPPELTTLCYLRQDNSYLMLHRIKKENDINHDKYIGVGGHFEAGESPEECLLREVKEETGLELTSYRARGIVTFCYGESITEYMHLYTADGWEGELAECDEGDAVWVDISELDRLPVWEGDRIFFKLLEDDEPFFSLKLVYNEEDVLCRAALNGRPIAVSGQLK